MRIYLVLTSLLLYHFVNTKCMRLHRPWTTQPLCDSVVEPHWPFEYEKQELQVIETKGRTSKNVKNIGHVCAVRGAKSKCHRCEKIRCGDDLNKYCSYQIQGIGNGSFAKNIASVSDTPWAVDGRHRNDFGGNRTSHVCVLLSGGDCIKPPYATSKQNFDYRHCVTRCWGNSPTSTKPVPVSYRSNESAFVNETVEWQYDLTDYNPQGAVKVLLGQPQDPGFLDGPATQSKFREPNAVAVDAVGNVFVADTGNHCIRRYSVLTNIVTTIAGIPGKAGFKDGIGTDALFNYPKGITLYYDQGTSEASSNLNTSSGVGQLVVIVSDTNNHKIRKIKWPIDDNVSSVEVTTLAGRTNHEPEEGFSDGEASDSRFRFPHGVSADDEGVVFVADTFNHVIRRVLPSGDVSTLAGHLEHNYTNKSQETGDPLCQPSCLKGVAGYRDGNLSTAQFTFPADVTIAENGTILVSEGHRVRRVTQNGIKAIIDDVELYNQVITVSGRADHGNDDGIDKEASFNRPTGIAMTRDGHIYVADSDSCRIRRISSAENVAKPITCSHTLLQIVRPSGCASYEPPENELGLKVTDISGNIHYNYRSRNVVEETMRLGKKVHRCQGSPPVRFGITSNGNTLGPNADTDYDTLNLDEDTDQGTAIYVQCSSSCISEVGNLYGTGIYTDDSSICLAAIHAGVILNQKGGLLKVIVESGQTNIYQSTFANGVQSSERVGGWHRSFSVAELSISERQVQTVAGVPGASQDSMCGFDNVKEELVPQKAKFNSPKGISVQRNKSLDAATFLYIADTGNHVIRLMTATCAKVCENGGTCVGPEVCSCSPGWSGEDCTIPVCDHNCSSNGLRSVCVAPNTCSCIPGYSNMPSCDQALCVQSCENGGTCVAPDTCECSPGWFDSNCTTPVCSQTCGNGGNCTGPDICTCPSDWTGEDCRQPVCRQKCKNEGICVAPDSCTCTAEWSGHDCSLPICTQGYLIAEGKTSLSDLSPEEQIIKGQRIEDASGRIYSIASERAGQTWRQYVPCNLIDWCDTTNDFDCHQPDRRIDDNELRNLVLRGEEWRNITGFDKTFRNDSTVYEFCERIELAVDARTPYSYEYAENETRITSPWRFQPPRPYSWNASSPGPDTFDDWTAGVRGWRASSPAYSDRIIAHVQWRTVPQGVYACANNGKCVAPDTCVCAPGWIGFDCRIPVCEQGYFQKNIGNGKVLFEGNNVIPEDYPGQGKYECSIRSVTEWENSEYILDHPNYYSRFMDHHDDEWGPSTRYQIERETPKYWDSMGWSATHIHTDPDGNHTQRGWTRKGYWERNHTQKWKKGKCKVEYERVCTGDNSKSLDVRRLIRNSLVANTDSAFRAVTIHSDKATRAIGRWHELGGECIDHVHRGCYNNGTCIAPNTCKCAPGWTGSDCSIPICYQTCSRSDDEDLGRDDNNLTIFSKGKGNCTLPDTCTCEKGWEGYDCSTALCAQECNNGGVCTAPDTCSCARWYSSWRENKSDDGKLFFRNDSGKHLLTGWTGYDCTTPICVQAKAFTANERSVGRTRLGGYGLILYGQEPYNNLRRPDIRFPPYEPFWWEWSFPPIKIFLPSLREFNKAIWAANGDNMLEYRHMLCRKFGYGYCVLYQSAEPYAPTWGLNDGEVVRNDGRSYQSGCKYESGRFSDYDNREGIKQKGYLCEVEEWEQGDYDVGRYIRLNDDATRDYMDKSFHGAKEGIYECNNYGSCVAPDTCSCPDGYTGYDCSQPLCRHRQVTGEIVSCQNEGDCIEKDTCECKQWMSTLHLQDSNFEPSFTGWNGTDCSIPMCAQASFYDPLCDGVALGGEGCFRCKNGGNCTAPDVCTCPPEWKGVDCGIPVCELTFGGDLLQLGAFFNWNQLEAFMLDPCQTQNKVSFNGMDYSQGSCTAPSTCNCSCNVRGLPFSNSRNPPPGFTYGTRDCVSGYEGIKNENGLFKSCHLKILEAESSGKAEQVLMTLLRILVFVAISIFSILGIFALKNQIIKYELLERATTALALLLEKVMAVLALRLEKVMAVLASLRPNFPSEPRPNFPSLCRLKLPSRPRLDLSSLCKISSLCKLMCLVMSLCCSLVWFIGSPLLVFLYGSDFFGMGYHGEVRAVVAQSLYYFVACHSFIDMRKLSNCTGLSSYKVARMLQKAVIYTLVSFGIMLQLYLLTIFNIEGCPCFEGGSYSCYKNDWEHPWPSCYIVTESSGNFIVSDTKVFHAIFEDRYSSTYEGVITGPLCLYDHSAEELIDSKKFPWQIVEFSSWIFVSLHVVISRYRNFSGFISLAVALSILAVALSDTIAFPSSPYESCQSHFVFCLAGCYIFSKMRSPLKLIFPERDVDAWVFLGVLAQLSIFAYDVYVINPIYETCKNENFPTPQLGTTGKWTLVSINMTDSKEILECSLLVSIDNDWIFSLWIICILQGVIALLYNISCFLLGVHQVDEFYPVRFAKDCGIAPYYIWVLMSRIWVTMSRILVLTIQVSRALSIILVSVIKRSILALYCIWVLTIQVSRVLCVISVSVIKQSTFVYKLILWVMALLVLQYTLIFIPISFIYPDFSVNTNLNETLYVGNMVTKLSKILPPERESIAVQVLVSVYTLFFVLISIEPFKMYSKYEDRRNNQVSVSKLLIHLLIRLILYMISHSGFHYLVAASSGSLLHNLFHNPEVLSSLLNLVFVISTTPLYERLFFGVNIINMTKMRLFLLASSVVATLIYYVVWKAIWVAENKVMSNGGGNELILVPFLNYAESSFCKLFFCFLAKKMTFDTLMTKKNSVNRDAAFAIHAFGQCFASVLKRIAILRLLGNSNDYNYSLTMLSALSCVYEILLRALNRTDFSNLIFENVPKKENFGLLLKFTRKIQPNDEFREDTRMVKWDKRINRFRSTMVIPENIKPFDKELNQSSVDDKSKRDAEVPNNETRDPLHMTGNPRGVSSQDETLRVQTDFAKKLFWAKYVIMDMVAEIYAICVIPLLYMVFQSLPFTTDAYIDHSSVMFVSNNQDDNNWKYDRSINFDFLTSWLFIQLAEEIISDSVSIAVEARYGFPVHLAFESVFSKRAFFTIKLLFCATSTLSIVLFTVPLYSFYRWHGAYVEAAISATNATGYDWQNICCNLGQESSDIYYKGVAGPRQEYCFSRVLPWEYKENGDGIIFRLLNVSLFQKQCSL